MSHSASQMREDNARKQRKREEREDRQEHAQLVRPVQTPGRVMIEFRGVGDGVDSAAGP